MQIDQMTDRDLYRLSWQISEELVQREQARLEDEYRKAMQPKRIDWQGVLVHFKRPVSLLPGASVKVW